MKVVVRIKSNVAVKELTHGIDVRLVNVLLWMNEKFKDVSITKISHGKISIDAGLYKKPAEMVDLINNYYPCAIYLESMKVFVLEAEL